MKLFWLIVAGGCVAVAAVFLLRGDFDRAFVVAAVGMLAWFLNYRMQVKAALAAKDSDQEQSDGGGFRQDRER
ncbi:MAG: hypothetical protein H0W34_00195 [Pyrinomonadaceae bacterium]|nr:hypothetical protein [Pyrinomonadaceae bacterium]MBA3570408.1 hypothetical protein [Pyrinomonadaceae bacterium]MDQ3174555.1 hypothetical protein [Acidobacteriota bacterium]